MARPINTLEKDKSNLKIGRLLIIHPIFRNTRNNKNRVFYKCICDCGKEVIRRGDGLVPEKNIRVSCGCWQKEIARDLKKIGTDGESFIRRVYSSYKKNAKSKLVPFRITIKEFEEIVLQDCYYCGIEPSRTDTIIPSNTIKINGIDRIIPKNGYIKGNIIPCCYPCNWRKSDDSKEDFINWVKQTYIHLVSIKEII